MSIVQWNPWREFDDLFTRVAGAPGEAVVRSEWLPPVDISETEKDYRIDVEIPSVAAADVDVSVKDGVLTVSGERRTESESDEGKRHRVERRWGRFSRSFRLPENVDADAIDARVRDGVLYLVIAKQDKAQPRRIEVNAS
ncbi:MAG: Hsp20/alpha crystallin family protein [Pseudomonadales bacterium]